MEKIVLILFCSPILFAQDYLPMAKENNSWKLRMDFGLAIGQGCGDQLSQKVVNYTIDLGESKTIDNVIYKEVFRKHEFNSLASFQNAKKCDTNAESSRYLGYLNESNYNQKVLVGYLRDDVQAKKVYLRDLQNVEEEIYDFSKQVYINPNYYVTSLYEINNAQYFNVQTKEFVYKTPALSSVQNIYEGIGDIKSDFVYQTSNNIDGVFCNLLGFSTDKGSSFYQKDNGLLKVNDLKPSKKYQLKQNPVSKSIEINTVKDIKQIKLIDVNGKIILQQETNFQQINVADLPVGKYYLVIISNSKQEVIGFLKK
ncbi:T9SS type A sorting domain-containing protein [Algoriella sp.]|uniref:T9SS type A sorting domain-containing protein n=1 Tax=Algoriella sp. TaxID=1872434 RepID=UPI002FC7C87C